MRRLLTFFLIVLAVGFAYGAWHVHSYFEFVKTPLNIGMQPVKIVVKPGVGLSSFSRQLALDGIISDRYLLLILARLAGTANTIRAGEYQLVPGMLPNDLLNVLVAGREVQYSFTIVEGWTTVQLFDQISKAKTLVHDLKDLPLTELPTKLNLPFEHYEGAFLPETYFYTRGTKTSALLRRANDALNQQLADAWENRSADAMVKTPYEALILASIIEKETGLDAERAEISGVFSRRLKRGMRLQTDPTVIYGMGDNYTGKIRTRDLRAPTPYNTYVISGLPPTPIALPGVKSIHTALHPKKGTSLYFVAKGDGSHVFSATLEEHNKAVRKYILKR